MLNLRLPLIAAIVSGLMAFSAQAAEATADKAPAKSTMTKEEKAAARAAKRAEAKGTMTTKEATAEKAPMAKGTSAERQAARAAKRAEVKEANKAGELPKTNEAGVVAPKK